MKLPSRLRVLIWSLSTMIMSLTGILQFNIVGAIAQPAQLNKVEIKPTSIEGGKPIEVVIRLTKKGSIWVKLNSSNNNIIPVQPNMPVQLNNVSSKSVFLNTNIISGASQFVTISASQGAVQENASVTVTPQGALGGGGGAYSIYKIKASELGTLYKHAQSKGWTFTGASQTNGPPGNCTLRTVSKGIKLTATHPDICAYDFFGGSRRLNTGWTLDKLVWSFVPSFRKKLEYIEKPKFGTDNPYFKVYFTPKTTSAVFIPTDYEYLLEIWLKGPQGAKWQDAF